MVLLDPIKVTLVMPRPQRGGALSDRGIRRRWSASLLETARAGGMDEDGLCIHSLVLFSMALPKVQWSSTLLTELLEFKA